ncbi:MAG TPA: Zn-dependent hydrolase [Candidatus Limnocylindrales bacterium]|nr:Zn-dependent hydrolase [Candidatus Limnocylindrales bacterium]
MAKRQFETDAGGQDVATSVLEERPQQEEATPVEADAARISRMISQLGRIGGGNDGSVSRLAFTEDERRAHALVGDWLGEIGLTVRADAVGNLIAELPGSARSSGWIGVGSHLDSVPNGGRFDGIVGVVGAVELARLLIARKVSLRHGLRVIAFAGEEGARFGEPCIGSKAAVGLLGPRDLDRIHDGKGTTLREAFLGIGLDPAAIPAARWRQEEWSAFLELHIEQGSTLYREGIPIGVVDMVSGSTRLLIDLQGRADHSGATPMHERADALAAAAEAIVAIENLVRDPRHHGTRVTVGYLEVEPNSITTIPGRVRFSVDVRDIDHERQRETALALLRVTQAVSEKRLVTMRVDPLADTAPSVLPTWLRGLAVEACRNLEVPYRVLSSGASHDSQIVNTLVPTAILFVPSREGLSHVPQEWTSSADIAKGVEVLCETLVRVDQVVDP